jgi:hypothetical protein
MLNAMAEQKLREYRAIIWRQDPTGPGQRVTVMATNGEDARRRLEREYGEGTVFDLHNPEDAETPR